jgi:hypothetical protein
MFGLTNPRLKVLGRAYPAPMVPGESLTPILRTKNRARSVAWWERLGFTVEWEAQNTGGGAVRLVKGSLSVELSEWKDTPVGMVEIALEHAEEVAAELGKPFFEDNVTEVEDPYGNRVRLVEG